MDPLAAALTTTPAADIGAPQAQIIPDSWFASGVVTPVATGNSLASPAARIATAFDPDPATAAGAVSQPALIDAAQSIALANARVAQAQLQAQQTQQLAMQQQTDVAPTNPEVQLPVVVAQAAATLLPAVVASPALRPPQLIEPAATASTLSASPVVAPATTTTTTAAPATTSAPATVSAVAVARTYAGATRRRARRAAGAGAARAKRAGTELWAGVRSPKTIHVSQVPSKFNRAPAAGNKDCGPASVVMALGLLGVSVPGTSSKTPPQRAINRVRQLAGAPSNGESTTNQQLEAALASSGMTTREVSDVASIRRAISSGSPVILNGNPRNPGAYGPSFSAKEMVPFNGQHWIVVSGWDSSAGKFIINDPLSTIGPVKVSADQLDAYCGGSLGIVVSR